VFDMERILEVTTGRADLIGRHGGRYYAFDHRYVLPQVATYRQGAAPAGPNGCVPTPDALCFSSVALDRSTTPDSLVVGEYRDSRDANPAVDGGRIARYPVAADTRKLALKAVPSDAVTIPKSNVQGVQTWNGRYYFGRSSAQKHSFLYSAQAGGPVSTFSWAIGGEDLYHEHDPNLAPGIVWTATEHAFDGETLVDKRIVFAVPLAAMTPAP
jgi:hypothetical protein